ncbi:endonuclease domain-containing protein [Candidatus Nitrosacidococcus sp. I8]|uniref:endonuclease domain-containing protein n=1 Tax=Candidatus Nitrosacidococcus sp. I8 TaxID=2942908 RepID=UPI0022274CB4|nr:endonuclease domain-containing protein [Candidatus Nitrosacidococcus sp. I8]CAH9017001.1 hypothetical protein NURINAE_00277 [Candidatus Nitrosacidococcus sp. I8]
MGVKFRRQYGIAHYIIDFYCPELKLAIEVDGENHFSETAQVYDKTRNHYLESLGILTLRFNNDEIMNNMEGVYYRIQQQIRPSTKKAFSF